MYNLKHLARLSSLAAFMAGAGVHAGEAPGTAGPGTRLDLAEQQRMRIAQITKAGCLVQLNPFDLRYSGQVRTAVDSALGDLTTLRAGSAALGLKEERAPVVLREINALEAATVALRRVVEAGVAQHALDRLGFSEGRDRWHLAGLVDARASAVSASRRVSEVVFRFHGFGLHPAKWRRLDMSRRQAVRTQTMAKLLCFVASGHDAAAARVELRVMLNQFESSLNVLRLGDYAAQIPGPASPRVQAEVAAFQADWAPVAQALTQVAEGAEVPTCNVFQLVSELDAAFVQTKRIADML